MTEARTNILSKIKQNQPSLVALPDAMDEVFRPNDLIRHFTDVVESIGAKVHIASTLQEVLGQLSTQFDSTTRKITTIPELDTFASMDWIGSDPHALYDVDLAIFKGQFGVAENGSIWLNEGDMGQRVAPFICQYLAIVLDKNDFVANMHEAMERVGEPEMGFGVFIAGPSKTADIEQSLVLGAHGARGLQIFILD
ncbi:MAG: LutC/YkgG family protein [Leadbetterella sp.]